MKNNSEQKNNAFPICVISACKAKKSQWFRMEMCLLAYLTALFCQCVEYSVFDFLHLGSPAQFAQESRQRCVQQLLARCMWLFGAIQRGWCHSTCGGLHGEPWATLLWASFGQGRGPGTQRYPEYNKSRR